MAYFILFRLYTSLKKCVCVSLCAREMKQTHTFWIEYITRSQQVQIPPQTFLRDGNNKALL